MAPPGRSGSLDATAMEARVRALSSDQRQYLVEGARHGEGRWDTAKVIDTVDRAEHRDAVIWSVRFFVWKHMWQRAGEFMRGLNDPDVRRVATRLALTWDDRVSFELTHGLLIRKITFLEGTGDGAAGGKKEDNFDADVAIATGELGQLVPALLDALGGEAAFSAAVPDEAPKAAATAPAAQADTPEEEDAPF